jgi:hypothetical protein
MAQKQLSIDKVGSSSLVGLVAIAALVVGGLFTPSIAQQPGQETFSSAEQAANALVSAAQSNDEKVMLHILGAAGRQIVSSGDEAEDTQNRANFVKRYHEMHRLVKEPDGTIVLYIGAENWPTPIPIVSKGNTWYFDTEAGKKEILFRRIGRNEASAIRVCQELVAAEKEFYSSHQSAYAQKLFSDEGQHNGLYWKAAAGEPQSPLGPLLAAAVIEENPASQPLASNPYRGYYFRSLKHHSINGFAFLAYPAEYRSSGVMTFIVTEQGVIYQKDLGKKTETAAKTMDKFSADASWQKAELPPQDEPGLTQSAAQR